MILQRRNGFTLVELLVVISIIALLIGILLPALGAARASAKFAVCKSHLRQMGIAMAAHAVENKGHLPVGPRDPMTLFGFPWGDSWDRIATFQIWVGTGTYAPGPTTTGAGFYHGAGSLLDQMIDDPEIFYCPDDNTLNRDDELAAARSQGATGAFSSYFYRQLDETTNNDMQDLGKNSYGFRATALAFDANNTDDNPQFFRTNHNGTRLNILFTDGRVANPAPIEVFTLTAEDNAGWPTSTLSALDEILTRADHFGAGRKPTEVEGLDY